MIARLELATVYVTDQDRALLYYRDALGFEVTSDVKWGTDFRWLTVAPRGGQAKLVLMKPTPEMGPPASLVGQRTGIVFYTEEIYRTYQELLDRGVHFTGEPQRRDWGGLEAQFADPDGNRFELVQDPRTEPRRSAGGG